MLPRSSPFLLLLIIVVCIFWFYVFQYYLSSIPNVKDEKLHLVEELEDKVKKLSSLVNEERRNMKHIKDVLGRVKEADRQLAENEEEKEPENVRGPWPEPIPVVVFVCNRATALKNHLDHLIRIRPSAEKFPIYVSHDCDNQEVTLTAQFFGDQIIYLKHVSGEKANLSIPVHHSHYATYYRIARHYKLALTHIFEKDKHTSVIITEDDLDVAPDFLEYFSATRHLLEEDSSLWCVQAWNDNGKTEVIDMSDPGRLYRSDFFSGLGWMFTSKLWEEIGPIWPNGFWDDWMRDPKQRRDRVCIRPEISRTSMTKEGKVGASKGQFFSKHLIKVHLNEQFVSFTGMDLSFLLKEHYDRAFLQTVYEDSVLMPIDTALRVIALREVEERSIRVEYNANLDYIRKADLLHVMHDFKAGVPRTAYKGIVPCFINSRRVYLAPDRNVIHGYDPSWEVPSNMGD